MRIENPALSPAQVLQAVAIGVGAAVIAAWLPSSEAARCDPARILHPGSAIEMFSPLRRTGLVWRTSASWRGCRPVRLLTCRRIAFRGLRPRARSLPDFPLMVPWLAVAVAALFGKFGVLPVWRPTILSVHFHRNALTIAALAAAIAMTISVTVMIHSFHSSVQRWTEHTLTADLYIAPAANEIGGLHEFLPEESLAWAEREPAVLEAGTFREVPIRFRDQLTALAVINGKARGNMEFLAGDRAARNFNRGHTWPFQRALRAGFVWRRRKRFLFRLPQGFRNSRCAGSIGISRGIGERSSCPGRSSRNSGKTGSFIRLL